MKKLFVVGIVVFWTIAVSILAAGLVVGEFKKDGVGEENAEGVFARTSSTTSENGDVTGKSVAKTQFMDASLVSVHNSKSDCWLIIEWKVYDVGEYIPFHPGGENDIISSCGTDATEDFNTKGDEGKPHSSSALAQLTRYYVADIGDAWGTVAVTDATQTPEQGVGPKKNNAIEGPTPTPDPVLDPAPNSETTPDPNPEPTPAPSAGLTASGVAVHNSANDCWLIINAKVYDVSQYIPFHPGGENRIISECGSDATTLFTTGVGSGHKHSSSANAQLSNYLLGDLDAGTTPPPPGTPVCTAWTYSSWGVCTSAGTQFRSIDTASPSGCAGGSPVTSQSCIYAAPTSPDQSYRDAVMAEYPGAVITKLSIEDDGEVEFKMTWNGEKYEGKMNAAYEITEIE